MDNINNHQFRHLSPSQVNQNKGNSSDTDAGDTPADKDVHFTAEHQAKNPDEVFNHLAQQAGFDPAGQRIEGLVEEFPTYFAGLTQKVSDEFPALSDGAAQRIAAAMAVNEETV